MTEPLLRLAINTHNSHIHTQSPLSVPAGEKTQPLGQGPGARGGIQRAVEVSPQFQIQPAVNYWHGKIQPCASTPSAAFKPNSSTSLCVCAWDSLDPNPAPQLLNKGGRKPQHSKRKRGTQREWMPEMRKLECSPWGQNEWLADILLAWLWSLVVQNNAWKKVSFHYIYCHNLSFSSLCSTFMLIHSGPSCVQRYLSFTVISRGIYNTYLWNA